MIELDYRAPLGYTRPDHSQSFTFSAGALDNNPRRLVVYRFHSTPGPVEASILLSPCGPSRAKSHAFLPFRIADATGFSRFLYPGEDRGVISRAENLDARTRNFEREPLSDSGGAFCCGATRATVISMGEGRERRLSIGFLAGQALFSVTTTCAEN